MLLCVVFIPLPLCVFVQTDNCIVWRANIGRNHSLSIPELVSNCVISKTPMGAFCCCCFFTITSIFNALLWIYSKWLQLEYISNEYHYSWKWLSIIILKGFFEISLETKRTEYMIFSITLFNKLTKIGYVIKKWVKIIYLIFS